MLNRFLTIGMGMGAWMSCWVLSNHVLADQTALPSSVQEVRRLGPDGLKMTMERFINVVNSHQRPIADLVFDQYRDECDRIDRIAGQRYGYLSKLFWYTDIETATEHAKSVAKPVLVLKMLGRLTDEMSCANSRFFRTALYVDPRISDYLRENFVLCWSSVRPVPRVTIDFGDGRKIERTITGNSAHYAMTANGQVLDVLPGVYGPEAFLQWIVGMNQLFHEYSKNDDAAQAMQILHRYHVVSVNQLQAVGVSVSNSDPGSTGLIQGARPKDHPTAIQAGLPRALSKGRVEQPLLNQIVLTSETQAKPGKVQLSEISMRLIAAENEKRPHESNEPAGVERLIHNFQESIAQDQIRNETTLHATIHGWLIESPNIQLELLNDRIYDQLFLTPSSDPWLGLATMDHYSGIRQGGLTIPDGSILQSVEQR